MVASKLREAGEEKRRKPRADKGTIQATPRDEYCIAWIAEQYAARGNQIRRLLSRFPDPEHPFKDTLIAETTLRDQIDRWRRAGWIEYKRVLAGQPGYAWVTRRGLQLVGLDDIYQARVPAATSLRHIYAVNQLRLFLDLKYTWISERRYRSEQPKTKKGEKRGPIPDGIVSTAEGYIAVEAEITAKTPDKVEAKVRELVQAYPQRDYMHVEAIFARVWFYVPNDHIKELIVDACQDLKEEERLRVGVGVNNSLLG